MQEKGYITLNITFGAKENSRRIKVRYFVIDAYSSYNMIIGQPVFNQLRAFLSTLYHCMKYSFPDGRVGVIQGD